MSLYIDVDKVDAVLLADGWHPVHLRTFDLDSYEYHRSDHVLLYGGRCAPVPSTGFRFEERLDSGSVVTVYGPLTSILAVQKQAS